jgi:hypothetical protein
MRQLFSITDKRVANWLDKAEYFTSLNLKDVYYWVWMKESEEWRQHSEQDMNTMSTLLCHLNLRMFLSSFKD